MSDVCSGFEKKGFTLIELLVVIAVIGVMMAAMVTVIDPVRRIQEARDSNRKQNLEKVVLSMEACSVKNNATYTYCGTQQELIEGSFLKSEIPEVSISSGCVSALLEAPLYPLFPYWRYRSTEGRPDYAPEGC